MGFLSRTPRFVTACLLGSLLFSGVSAAQDYDDPEVGKIVDRIKSTFGQWERTGDQTKKAELVDILGELEARDLSQKDALKALGNIDAHVTITMTTSTRGAEATRLLGSLFGAAQRTADADAPSLDDVRGAIEGYVTGEGGLLSDLITDQSFARQVLATEYGDLAVPTLLDLCTTAYHEAKGDQASRVHVPRAILTLQEMGQAATPPLLAALRANDPVVRRNVLKALELIRDARSVPFLAFHASEQNESDPIARENAASALKAVQQVYPRYTDTSFGAFGESFLARDENLVSPFQVSATARIWSYGSSDANGDGSVGAHLKLRKVPRAVLAYEWAKDCFYASLMANENADRATAGLARAYCGGQAAGAGNDDLASLVERSSVPVRLLGVDVLDKALGAAIGAREYSIAERLIGEMGQMVDAGSVSRLSSLLGALNQTDKAISYAAALALARVIEAPGVPKAAVLGKLRAAVSEQSVFVVHLIDSNAQRLQSTAAGLQQLGGFYVRTHGSGKDALRAMNSAAAADAVVMWEGNYALTPLLVFKGIGSGSPIKRCLVTNNEDAQSKWDARIGSSADGRSKDLASAIWVNPNPSTLRAGLQELLKDSLDSERLRANAFARDAANALSAIYPESSGLQSVADALIGVITDASRPVDTVHPAVAALSRVGGQDAIAPMLAIFSGTTKPEDADDDTGGALRLAAGEGLWRIIDRSRANLTEDQLGQVAGILGDDNAVALAAATILGHSSSLTAASRMQHLAATRVNLAVD